MLSRRLRLAAGGAHNRLRPRSRNRCVLEVKSGSQEATLRHYNAMGMNRAEHYQNDFVGNYKPCCGGKFLVLQSSEADAVNLAPVSFLLILLPCILWTYVVPPFSQLDIVTTAATSIVEWIFVFCSLYNLVKCYITEPGNLPFKEVEAPLEEGCPETYNKIVLLVNGEEVALITKRAKVCRQTNTVIERFDHYCPWTGNAIGRRNYPFFFSFACSVTLLSLITFISSLVCVVGQSDTYGGFSAYLSANSSIATFQAIVCVYSIILFLTLIGLTTYHINLVCKNITTNEDLKGVYRNHGSNPHDEGICNNIMSILMSPTPPSRVKKSGSSIQSPLI